MFKYIIVLLAVLALLAIAAPVDEEEKALNEFRAAGMSENGIKSLVNLENKFKAEYPLVAGNKNAVDKYLENFAADAQIVVKSMSEQDQIVYNAHKEEIGLE